MHKPLEEILEAAWTEDERGDTSLDAIRARCPVEITEEQLEQLHKDGLITRERGRLTLTYEGRSAARGVVRRHRLAETLFATVLNIEADQVHSIACEAEHTLLPEVEEGICTLLGHPPTCPHGKPIPPGRCCGAKRTLASTVVVNLTHMAPGERGRIRYIKPKDHARLHRLTSFGLTPGTLVEVHQRSPAVCIRFEGTELALDYDVADDIYLLKTDDLESSS